MRRPRRERRRRRSTNPPRQYPSAEHRVRSGPKRYCGREIEERERHPGPRPDSADDRGIGPGPGYKYCCRFTSGSHDQDCGRYQTGAEEEGGRPFPIFARTSNDRTNASELHEQDNGGDIGQERVAHEEAAVGIDPAGVLVGVSEVRRVARNQEKNECRDLNDHIDESEDAGPPTPVPSVHGPSLKNATNSAASMDADAVLPIAGDHAWDWAGKTAVGSTLPALTGTTPWIRLPRPFDSTRRVPPTAPSRSRMLVRPAPSPSRPASKPAPSSQTSNSRPPASSQILTRAVASAPACLAAFCIASRQQKYTAASISG